jgi:hypothetical protein
MRKRFMIVQKSDKPLPGRDDVFGYILLAPDAEMWRVARRHSFEAEWLLGEVIEVEMMYLGPDELAVNLSRVSGCIHWEPWQAKMPYLAVEKFWGVEVAERFVPKDR